MTWSGTRKTRSALLSGALKLTTFSGKIKAFFL
jgi:hypothetical protein